MRGYPTSSETPAGLGNGHNYFTISRGNYTTGEREREREVDMRLMNRRRRFGVVMGQESERANSKASWQMYSLVGKTAFSGATHNFFLNSCENDNTS